jgi:hypothetical protein
MRTRRRRRRRDTFINGAHTTHNKMVVEVEGRARSADGKLCDLQLGQVLLPPGPNPKETACACMRQPKRFFASDADTRSRMQKGDHVISEQDGRSVSAVNISQPRF